MAEVPLAAAAGGDSSCGAIHKQKSSQAWQLEQWRMRPRLEDWPDRMDVYEAAAYLRSSYHTIRRLCIQDRGGRAALPHQRVGTSYRIRRSDLDSLGATEASGVATWKRAVATMAPLLTRGLAPATLAKLDKRQGRMTQGCGQFSKSPNDTWHVGASTVRLHCCQPHSILLRGRPTAGGSHWLRGICIMAAGGCCAARRAAMVRIGASMCVKNAL